MVAVRLEDDALAFAAAQLDAAGGGIASELHQERLWEPVVFVPDFVDPLTLPALDEDAGWTAVQEGTAAELASYLMFLKKRDARLKSVIFDDPWAQASDLDYDGATSDDLLMMQGRVAYVQDIARMSPEMLWEWRAVSVSYLKLIYVSELTPAEIRALADAAPDNLFHRLAHSVRHVAVNAYDDESWLILRHEQVQDGERDHPHGACDCGDDCDCDGDSDGECGNAGCDCHHHDNDD